MAERKCLWVHARQGAFHFLCADVAPVVAGLLLRCMVHGIFGLFSTRTVAPPAIADQPVLLGVLALAVFLRLASCLFRLCLKSGFDGLSMMLVGLYFAQTGLQANVEFAGGVPPALGLVGAYALLVVGLDTVGFKRFDERDAPAKPSAG